MNIKKGDNVIVIAGSNKGKKGKVIKAIPTESKVIIDGVNLKKIARKAKAGEVRQLVSVAMPIHVSNVKKQD
jgi:large subunit ribosomal protein L24